MLLIMSDHKRIPISDLSNGAINEDANDIQELLDDIFSEYSSEMKIKFLFSTDFPNINYTSDPIEELRKQLIEVRNKYE